MVKFQSLMANVFSIRLHSMTISQLLKQDAIASMPHMTVREKNVQLDPLKCKELIVSFTN